MFAWKKEWGGVGTTHWMAYPRLEHQTACVWFLGLLRCHTPGCTSQSPPAACRSLGAGSALQHIHHVLSHSGPVPAPGPSSPEWWVVSTLAVCLPAESLSTSTQHGQCGFCSTIKSNLIARFNWNASRNAWVSPLTNLQPFCLCQRVNQWLDHLHREYIRVSLIKTLKILQCIHTPVGNRVHQTTKVMVPYTDRQ